MRQLVSVIDESALRYFISDGDEATQVAQIVNVGLDVPDVIKLGVNLVDALHLNGSTTNTTKPIATRAPRALPPASDRPLTPHEQKQRQQVMCPTFADTGCMAELKRTSLSRHLENRHGWPHARAMRAEHTVPAIDSEEIETTSTRSPYVPKPKPKRSQPSERRLVTLDWPNATPEGVFAFIEAHPDGVSIREIALALCDESPRARQTIGNKIATLRSQGVIDSFDGERPHYKSGTPQPTVLYRARR